MLAGALIIVLLFLFVTISLGWVSCPFNSWYGVSCPACGISRDINQYLTGDFSTGLNPYSFRIFVFFIGQVLLRFLLGTFTFREKHLPIIKWDIALTSIWILWCYGPMIYNTSSLFKIS